MNVNQLFLTLLEVFIMLLPGYVLIKVKILDKDHTVVLSRIITYVTCPCMIIDAMQLEFSWEIINNCKFVAIIFTIIIAVAFGVSQIITHIINISANRKGIMIFMMVFGNTGFIGLPILNALFGKEAVFYGVFCDSIMGIFLFTVGDMLICSASQDQDKGTSLHVLKYMCDPCFISIFIGLFLFFFQINLPDIIGGPIESIGNTTGPLAMILVGGHLAKLNFKSIFLNKLLYLIVALKLLVAPAIALLLVEFIIGNSTLVGAAIVIQSAMPCGMLAVVFGEKHNADTEFATKGVMLATLLCIVTIPLAAMLCC